jgi:hypothetical protein
LSSYEKSAGANPTTLSYNDNFVKMFSQLIA